MRARRPPFEKGPALVVLAAASCLSYAASTPFLRDVRLAVPLSLLAALPLTLSLLSLLDARRSRQARVRLQMLLQHLCAAMSSGRSPETALAEALPVLVRFHGPSSRFCRGLRAAVLALQSGRSFAEAVQGLPDVLPCPEARPVFQALASGRVLGSRVLDLLRAALAMTGERMQLERDAAAQSASRRLEAALLSMMPFASAFALQGAASGFFDVAFADSRGRTAMAAIYLVAVSAAALALHIVSRGAREERSGSGGTERRSAHRAGPSAPPEPGAPESASRPLPWWVPAAYGRHLLRMFSREAGDPARALAAHLARKPPVLAAGALAFAGPVLLVTGSPLAAVLAGCAGAGTTGLLHDRDARAGQRERDRRRITSYPMFLGLVVALLSAGIVPLRALEVARAGMSAETGRVLADDLDRTLARIRGGKTPADALDRLSLECGVPEIAAALSLLAQYDRRGGASTLELLRLQSSACWVLARAETRRRLEEVSTRLLLPTAIDLLAVVSLAGIPAILSLQPL